MDYITAATVCIFKINNTPLTTVQLALLMTNEQTGKLFKEKRNSQELSRKELCLAGVQFSDCRGSPTSTDSTNTKFKNILIPPTSPQLTQKKIDLTSMEFQQPRSTIRAAMDGKATKA